MVPPTSSLHPRSKTEARQFYFRHSVSHVPETEAKPSFQAPSPQGPCSQILFSRIFSFLTTQRVQKHKKQLNQPPICPKRPSNLPFAEMNMFYFPFLVSKGTPSRVLKTMFSPFFLPGHREKTRKDQTKKMDGWNLRGSCLAQSGVEDIRAKHLITAPRISRTHGRDDWNGTRDLPGRRKTPFYLPKRCFFLPGWFLSQFLTTGHMIVFFPGV